MLRLTTSPFRRQGRYDGPARRVGDPAFWFTLRPILGALGASLALSGSIAGPLLFFFAWNIIRYAFLWYTQEFGYKVGSSIAKDLSGGLMGKVTEGASILGMFIIGAWSSAGCPSPSPGRLQGHAVRWRLYRLGQPARRF